MPRIKKRITVENETDKNTAIDYINRDIVNVKLELQVLNKLVRDGNGQPSLMQQVSKIGSDLEHLRVNIKEDFDEIKGSMKSHHDYAVERNKVSWQSKSVIWVALISGITSVTLHLIKS